MNHVLIFELDPRRLLTEQHLMEMAAGFGFIWNSSVLVFLHSSKINVPAYVIPLILQCLIILFLLNPTKTFHHEARFWLLRALRRIVLAPFFDVRFVDSWIADQLSSLDLVLRDFHYLVCFYVTSDFMGTGRANATSSEHCRVLTCLWLEALVSCLPAWFRFAQCIRRYVDTRRASPHLVNATKYSTTFVKVIFATLSAAYSDGESYHPFFYIYLLSAALSSCFTFVWDVKMDWGLFTTASATNRNVYLRDELVYPSSAFYYFAVFENLILRFSWDWQRVLADFFQPGDFKELFVTLFALLEIVHRFIWNFLRLEVEHIKNCNNLSAVRDIPVVATEKDLKLHPVVLKINDLLLYIQYFKPWPKRQTYLVNKR